MSEAEEIAEQDFSTIPTFEAVYKDGQMEIIQVAPPYEMKSSDSQEKQELSLQALSYSSDNSEEENFVKVDPETLNVQLDMLNFTLVRYDEDGEGTYRLVANNESACDDPDDGDDTVTCVLHADQEQAAVISGANETYVMMQSSDGETMYLQASSEKQGTVDSAKPQDNAVDSTETLDDKAEEKSATKKLTFEELLLKHKAVQRVRELVSAPVAYNRRGRKRKSDLPPPHELLQSPALKLYLYNCKQCPFKCNAVRDLHDHRRQAHVGNVKPKGRSVSESLSCNICRFKTSQASLLKKHIEDSHQTELDEDVLVVINNPPSREQQATYLNIIDTPTTSEESNLFTDSMFQQYEVGKTYVLKKN